MHNIFEFIRKPCQTVRLPADIPGFKIFPGAIHIASHRAEQIVEFIFMGDQSEGHSFSS